ncbi:MAG: FAD-dependent oxidoreductase [Thermoplasmatales archaeon]|nr:MAG: FAD-dependent oxidoreductase [Thermoplasmatales archaeon]
MTNENVDVAVIGSGPAGLAAAVSAKENGANYVVIIDRNSWKGGILPQCIHDGFGLEETGNSMTGPEYIQMYIDDAKKHNIDFLTETMVINIDKNKTITAVNKNGIYKINAESIILSMGCREKTRWNIMVPGDRPSGIYTAGVAQAFINLYNIIPGKNIVILGSGDVGLIMARRLKLEGLNVLGVLEILPHASGLPRNVVQCLDDYEIPLYLNHTVTHIDGRERLESVTIAQIDNKKNIVKGSEKKIKCDTLLLSFGLIPENELSKDAGIKIDNITGGPVVDQTYETNIPGIYACGNCLQVYDTVDVLSKSAKLVGKNAVVKLIKNKKSIFVKPGKNIRYVIPQIINKKGLINFTMRVNKPAQNVTLKIKADEKEIYKKKQRWVNPANMIELTLEITHEILKKGKTLVVNLHE